MSDRISRTAVDPVHVRSLSRGAYTEVWLTGIPVPGDPHPIEAVMGALATALREHGVVPISEKVFASRGLHGVVRAARARAYAEAGLDPSVPVTVLEGSPPEGPGFAGVQVMGVAGRDAAPHVATVDGAGGARGRLWTTQSFRILHMSAVRGTDRAGDLEATVTEQAARMFANAEAALEAAGMGYDQVARTWIYCGRLLDWYGELNRVRTAHHARLAPGGDLAGVVFPASTGIQGCLDDEECFMDVLAVDAGGGDAAPMVLRPLLASARQAPSFRYGSAFSRGMVLESHGVSTIHVSGTASIDGAGRSVHLEDPDAQVAETLLDVAALLETEGARLSHIASAVVYCKDEAALAAFERARRLLELPRFPAVALRADVCRPELLVEIEAVALV